MKGGKKAEAPTYNPQRRITFLEGVEAGLRARIETLEAANRTAAQQVLEERRINAALVDDLTEANRVARENRADRDNARRDAINAGCLLAERTAERDRARVQLEEQDDFRSENIVRIRELEKRLADMQPVLLLFVAARLVSPTRTVRVGADDRNVAIAKRLLDEGHTVVVDFNPTNGETIASLIAPDAKPFVPPWEAPPVEAAPAPEPRPSLELPVFQL